MPNKGYRSETVCASIVPRTIFFSDWTAARQDAVQVVARTSTLQAEKMIPIFKDMILDNGNIAWKAINRNDFFLTKDAELAELFMSLSGTIIIHKSETDDNASNQITNLPSLAVNSSLLKALMHGGQAQSTVVIIQAQCLFKCDTKIN